MFICFHHFSSRICQNYMVIHFFILQFVLSFVYSSICMNIFLFFYIYKLAMFPFSFLYIDNLCIFGFEFLPCLHFYPFIKIPKKLLQTRSISQCITCVSRLSVHKAMSTCNFMRNFSTNNLLF